VVVFAVVVEATVVVTTVVVCTVAFVDVALNLATVLGAGVGTVAAWVVSTTSGLEQLYLPAGGVH